MEIGKEREGEKERERKREGVLAVAASLLPKNRTSE
jgi:hypothetical protein